VLLLYVRVNVEIVNNKATVRSC